MTIAHVKSAQGSGSSTTPQATFGSATVAGNLLLAWVVNRNASAFTANSGAGWSKVANTDVAESTNLGGCMFWKVATGLTTEQPCSISPSQIWTCSIVEYSGCDTSSPIDVSNGGATAADANPISTPTIDPVDGVERLIFCGAGIRNTGVSWSAEAVNGSTTGVNERTDQAATNASSCSYDKIEASTAAGTYSGDATASTAGASSVEAIAAIKPAVTSRRRPPIAQSAARRRHPAWGLWV